MDQDYKNFVERMGSFEMELPDLDDLQHSSSGTRFVKIQKDELTHYGVKGMRWGIRRSARYGPPENNKRYKIKNAKSSQLNSVRNMSTHSSNITKEGVNINKSIGDIKSTRRKEDLSLLSDDDLKAKINRMNLEQQYVNLNSGQISKGQSYARSTLEIAGSVLAIGSSAVGIALAVKELKGG